MVVALIDFVFMFVRSNVCAVIVGLRTLLQRELRLLRPRAPRLGRPGTPRRCVGLLDLFARVFRPLPAKDCHRRGACSSLHEVLGRAMRKVRAGSAFESYLPTCPTFVGWLSSFSGVLDAGRDANAALHQPHVHLPVPDPQRQAHARAPRAPRIPLLLMQRIHPGKAPLQSRAHTLPTSLLTRQAVVVGL